MKTPVQRFRMTVGAALFGMVAALPARADIELTIEADEPGLQISRHLYGQFSEHLGRSIYGGIWVGEDSPIPNTDGFRNDVVEALRNLQIPVLRWPGGCFADEYHWRDGIGPRDERPMRINTHWGWVREDNSFGTHEFFQLVDMLGTEPYIAGNVGSGTPREMAEWLAYMTQEKDTTLAELRRRHGREEPWDMAFWGVGNETWGCGGNMRPDYYADLYKRFATFLKAPEGNRPKLVASGGNDANTDWTEALASAVEQNIDGISHHYYTTPTGEWEVKGSSTGFPEEEWISTFVNTMKIDEYIRLNKEVLEKHDPDGNIGLYLDEWGMWYDPEPDTEPGFLYQQNTLRDALVAAINFNIFHRHVDRVHMANIAQTVNVLQAMVLTDEEKMVLTPTYHAFRMYIPFQDATFIPIGFDDMRTYEHAGHSVPSVTASAARDTGGNLVLALVNLDPHDSATVTTRTRGGTLESATGRVLTAPEMDSMNRFDNPDAVRPEPYEVSGSGNGELTLELPAKSIVVVTLQ